MVLATFQTFRCKYNMLTRKQRFITNIVIAVLIAAFIGAYLYASGVTTLADDTSDSIFNSATSTLNQIYTGIGSVLTAVALLALAVCAFQWVTAGGNQQQIQRAKSWIMNIVIGLLIYWLAYVIVNTVINLVPENQQGLTG